MPVAICLLFPIIAWRLTGGIWHLPLAIGYATFVIIVGAVYVRNFRRATVVYRADPLRWATPLWAPEMPAELYASQLSMSLQLQGWRVVSALPAGAARVEVLAKKDRWTVALLCIGPGQAATQEDITRLAALRRDAGASHAALVTGEPEGTPPPAIDLATALLRFGDLARLEDMIGLRSQILT